jgi:hypothetical protein
MCSSQRNFFKGSYSDLVLGVSECDRNGLNASFAVKKRKEKED